MSEPDTTPPELPDHMEFRVSSKRLVHIAINIDSDDGADRKSCLILSCRLNCSSVVDQNENVSGNTRSKVWSAAAVSKRTSRAWNAKVKRNLRFSRSTRSSSRGSVFDDPAEPDAGLGSPPEVGGAPGGSSSVAN